MKQLLLALVLLLLPGEAMAASRVWMTEFAALVAASSGGSAQIAPLPAIARQQVDITGGVQTFAAVNASTKYVRIICEVQCAVRGDGAAATTDTLLPAFLPEYFGVTPGATISVIAAP